MDPKKITVEVDAKAFAEALAPDTRSAVEDIVLNVFGDELDKRIAPVLERLDKMEQQLARLWMQSESVPESPSLRIEPPAIRGKEKRRRRHLGPKFHDTFGTLEELLIIFAYESPCGVDIEMADKFIKKRGSTSEKTGPNTLSKIHVDGLIAWDSYDEGYKLTDEGKIRLQKMRDGERKKNLIPWNVIVESIHKTAREIGHDI